MPDVGPVFEESGQLQVAVIVINDDDPAMIFRRQCW